MKKYLFLLTLLALNCQGFAQTAGALKNPEQGVLCDKYICANKNGISIELTEKYVNVKQAKRLKAQKEFDGSEFTFSNGIFCDVKEKLCHEDRYFENGKRSKISKKYTTLLFPGNSTK